MTFRDIAAGALSAAVALTDHLFEQTLDDKHQALGAYYAGQPEGPGGSSVARARLDMDPALADVLGLTPGQVVSHKQLTAILSGRRTDGKDLPGSSRKVRRYKQEGKEDRIKLAGMDLCFSAPKSFSLAWAFAETEAERASLMQCHLDARDAVLRHIEREIGHGRVGANGQMTTEPAKLAWISIEHFTARPTATITRPDPVTGVMGTELYTVRQAGDPNVHSHNIIPNVMVTDSGKVVSINQGLLAPNIHLYGAIYQALLADNLRAMGVRVDLCDEKRYAVLPAIPKEICAEFSKRTRDAEGAAREEAGRRGLDWDAMSQDDRVKFLKGGAKASRKAKTDDLADFQSWQEQAAGLGWAHETVIEGPQASLDDDTRREAVRQTALPLLSSILDRKAVLSGSEVTLQVVRGAIKWGLKALEELKTVSKMLVQHGIEQDGAQTDLVWTEQDGRVKVTTALHIGQELEVIDRTRARAADLSRALTVAEIDQCTDGLDFTTPEGMAQREVMNAIGTGGEFAVAIGSAGAGKSALMSVLTSAWRRRKMKVIGTALSWKIARRMEMDETYALDPLINRLEKGKIAIDRNAVIVIDELSQIGTVHLLKLLRLQQRYGFKIAAIGDHLQAQSIAAGSVIDLLQRAMPEAIPQLLINIRQKTEREKKIAGLFRDGKAGDAIKLKREDGTAELVEGDRAEAIARIAQLAMTMPDATLSTPTNADAMDIGRAIRKLKQETGEISYQETLIKATDNQESEHELSIAQGDCVRLFAVTRSSKGAVLGVNGSVLTVTKVHKTGLDLTTHKGKTGFVSWDALKYGGERVKLAYGTVLTVESSQGLTSDNHISCFPSGTSNVNQFRAYVSASRHRLASWIIVSKGAEMLDISNRLPLGINDPIDDDAIWDHVASNLSRRPKKENAVDLLEQFAELKSGFAQSFQATSRIFENEKSASQARIIKANCQYSHKAGFRAHDVCNKNENSLQYGIKTGRMTSHRQTTLNI
ncbi:MobF family relaxase [Roseicella sp. DB1501]|uniref:MobF family relaxase n=1 Tax=Roseicella sp. DB1501 TaxID=2730925 RepID=UPI001492C019|nr:MobF family relaxase [Roseicella sp. DB1501]NOG73721.1 relaxase domain-containing protein [Roseicella sp. DB1501]